MSRRRKSRRFRSIGDVLPRVLRKLNLEETVKAQKAVQVWPDVVGEKAVRHARALSIEDKTLLVAVDSPGWMTQLIYLKPQLLRRLKQKVKKGVVKDIRFVLGMDSGPISA